MTKISPSIAEIQAKLLERSRIIVELLNESHKQYKSLHDKQLENQIKRIKKLNKKDN